MICENCMNEVATERHHKFSQTKNNKRTYGNLIHEDINIQYLCYNCHHNKTLTKWDEHRFRKELVELGYELPEIKKATGRCRREA
jgi:hypothetical protein